MQYLIISPKVAPHDTLSVSRKRIHLEAVLVTLRYPLPVTTRGRREGGVEGRDSPPGTRLLPRVSPGLTGLNVCDVALIRVIIFLQVQG